MPRALIALTLGLASSTAWAACPAPTTLGDVDKAVADGEIAYVRLDIDAFTAARRRLTAAVNCLGEPLTPATASAAHRMMGLDSYLDDQPDDDRTIAWFRSAIAANDGATLAASIAPKGNPLRVLFDKARTAGPGPDAPLEPPPGTSISVDANPFPARPTERPALVQLLGGGGAVYWTGFLAASSPAPDWSSLGVPVPDSTVTDSTLEPETPPPAAPVRVPKSGPRVGLLLAGGGFTLAAGGLYAVAWGMSRNYDDIDNPDIQSRADLDSLRGKTNTLVWASAGALGVGLALGSAAWLDATPGGWVAGWRTTW